LRIQLRFLIILSFVGVGSVIVTGISISYLVENILEDKILNQMDATASIQKSRIDEAIEQSFERLQGVTSRTQLRVSLNDYLENNEGEYNLINKILSDAHKSINDFHSVTIIDSNGIGIFSTDETEINKDYSESKIFTEGMSDKHISLNTDTYNEKNLIVSGPLILDGIVLGVLVIYLDENIITNIVNDYTNLDDTGETILAIKNEHGDAQFITESRFGAENFGPIPKSDLNIPVTHALLMHENQFTDIIDYRGEPVLSSTRYIEKTDWGLVVKIDKSEAFESLELIQYYVGVISTMVGTTSILFAFYFSKTLSSPIKKLKKVTESLSEGNFDVNVNVSTGDELEELANSFNKMSTSLKKITDLKEQLAIQSNLKRALDVSADVAVTDKNGIITYVNDEFCKTSQYTREELVGKNHRILKSNIHTPEFYKNMWDTIYSGSVWHDQIQNKAKDGTVYWNDMVIVPFLDKNKKIIEFISIRRNITERIQLQQDKIKNEKLITIGGFSSRLAHDLRNPLSIIQMTMENLKLLYGTDEKKQKQFEKIERSISRIVHQVDDVLNFVKEKPAKLSKTKMSKIIFESLDSVVIPNTIKLILPEKDADIICDKEQLVIALNNLILNSIQTVQNVGTIEIRIKEITASIIIEVQDSGPEISKEIINKIFDPLFTTKMQGTGLGLVSVKSIIDTHGGTITVTSPPTIFKIVLPKIDL
jgi:PAS domain S-box-containing protein